MERGQTKTITIYLGDVARRQFQWLQVPELILSLARTTHGDVQEHVMAVEHILLS